MKVSILSIASFLLFLLGCDQRIKKTEMLEQIFPIEKFSVIKAKMPNEKPIIGSINQAYRDYDNKAKYPWCLKLSIGLNPDSCFENGLPKSGESQIADKEEDKLVGAIKKLAIAHYIGHLFSDTFLDVYIYLDEPKKVYQYLQTNKDSLARGIGYQINKDPNWTTVQGFFSK